jgi:uncharacterized RDD family membrane protein YckC
VGGVVTVTRGTEEPRVETASWLRRVGALAIDWAASTFAVIGLIGLGDYVEDPRSGAYVLGVFVVENTLLTTLAGGSFGKLLVGLRVVRVDGRGGSLGLLAAWTRSVLIALVIPPLVFRPDGRGLHDLAARSATVIAGSRTGRSA